METTTHQIPRAKSDHPMYIGIPRGAEVPVRMRDDLDPHAPPAEYADGRVEWSGHPSRGARDTARAAAEADLASRRADTSSEAQAIRAYAAAQAEVDDVREAMLCGAIEGDHWRTLQRRAGDALSEARAELGRVPSSEDLYRAGVCWYPHSHGGSCAGCERVARE